MWQICGSVILSFFFSSFRLPSAVLFRETKRVVFSKQNEASWRFDFGYGIWGIEDVFLILKEKDRLCVQVRGNRCKTASLRYRNSGPSRRSEGRLQRDFCFAKCLMRRWES